MKESKKTKRTSFDLTEENSKLLAYFSKKMDAPYSHCMNYMLRVLLRLSPRVKKSLIDFCNHKILEICDNLDYLSSFEKEEAKIDLRHYQELSYFFNDGNYRPIPIKEKGMKKIYLKKGYVLVPEDWIILDNFADPINCLYAGVVETRQPLNGNKTYDSKHYLFCCDYQYGKDYPSNLDELVYDACIEKDPDFRKILNARVEARYKDNIETYNNLINEEEVISAPCPGLFHIVVKDDPTYWHDHNKDYIPPHGAMIIR